MSKYKYILLFFSLFLSAFANAVPARKVVKTVIQQDGTNLQIVLGGDEYFRYYTTTDGVPLVWFRDNYYYGQFVADSLQADTCWMAHEPALRGAEEMQLAMCLKEEFLKYYEAIHENRIAQKYSQMLLDGPTTRTLSSFGGQVLQEPLIGSKKGLVILVNFQDVKMKTNMPKETFHALMNEEGYKGYGMYGSVRDYFLAQSYGAFDLSFDVVGPVTVSQEMAYYGANLGGNDIRPGVMVLEACKLVDPEVNFAEYDWDGDGMAEQIYLIYAGYPESDGAPAETIWPHQFQVTDTDGSALVLDNTIIKKYACSSELAGVSGSTVAGIGAICHEFSHCFGLPDFYDTRGSNFGMDVWSLMDYGCYNNNGYTPIGFSAYERMFCGWLEPQVLFMQQPIQNMPALSDEPVAYFIQNEANQSEYYVLENRQKKGWDSEMSGHGLLVVHVDYNQSLWTSNIVNTSSSRQRMTIIPADNSLGRNSSDYAGDLYPGSSNNRNLTNESVPAACLNSYNVDGSRFMNKPIYNIREENGLISFDYMRSYSTDVQDLKQMSDEWTFPFTVYRSDGLYIGRFWGDDWMDGVDRGVYILKSGKLMRKVSVLDK